MLLTDLPIETLDHVAAALDSPIDLTNLAAVCTQLRLLVEPYHTQFRVIRAPLSSRIWEKLADNQLLAQNVRVLEIQSESSFEDPQVDEPVLPSIFSNLEGTFVPELESENEDNVDALRAHDTAKNARDLSAERILVAALKGMSRLTSFQWSRTPPLINPDQEDDIWATIAKCCPSLDAIDVSDREKDYEPILEELDDPAYQRPTLNPNFYLFQDLRSFSFTTEAFNVGNFTIADFVQGGEMLVKKCPNLEVLKVQYVLYLNPHIKNVSAASLLNGPPWASLHEITLFGFHIDPTEFSSFIALHPIIEVLSLTVVRIDGPVVLSAGSLPLLRRLSTDPGSPLAQEILDATTSIPRPLEYIFGPLLSDVFLDKLEQSLSGPTISKLITVGGDNHLHHLITRLSAIVPNLTWLDLNCPTGPPVDRSLHPIFGQMPHLRTLRGVRFLDSNSENNTETIRALVSACPKLRRIDWYMGTVLDRRLAVVIERHEFHGTWCLRKTPRRNGVEIEGDVDLSWHEKGHGSFHL